MIWLSVACGQVTGPERQNFRHQAALPPFDMPLSRLATSYDDGSSMRFGR
jgi:hypothetical protein